MPNLALRPQSITNADGTVTNVSDYDLVKDYPGQDKPCGVCGAFASEAPEGVYGSTATQKTPAGKNEGDAVWTASHCFKCGNRATDAIPTEDLTAQFQAFKSWRDQQTASDRSHPTASITTSPNTDLQAELAKVKADLEKALAGNSGPSTSENS